MSKKYFMFIFGATHLVFVFLLIYRHTLYVRASFTLQKNERLLAQLKQEKQELTNKLYALQNHTTIQEFAQTNLQMQHIKLSQVVKIDDHENRNE